MKKTNIIYWIFTGLLAVLMIISAVGGLVTNPHGPGHDETFGLWASCASLFKYRKVIGGNRLANTAVSAAERERAYAGFMFDLLGALYSFIVVGDPLSQWIGLVIGLVLIAISYIYWHKKLRLQTGAQ